MPKASKAFGDIKFGAVMDLLHAGRKYGQLKEQTVCFLLNIYLYSLRARMD